MRIGLTYDLREEYLALGFSEEETAEFDSPVTVAGIEGALNDLGFETDRVGNLRSLVARLAAGDRWDMIFNIAEGQYGFAREAQVPALLEAYGIPCTFSDALTLSVCLHKAVTKRLLRDAGVATPDFLVVEKPEEAARSGLAFPVFAKPVAEGTSKGISGLSVIRSGSELVRVCSDLLARFRQPVLVERFLPGREFTVGIAGTGAEARILGVMEVVLGKKAEQGVYSFSNKEEYEDRVQYRLAADDEARMSGETALAAWRALGCRDAGRVDLRLDETGCPSVIEVNPLPGLNPERSDLPILCGLAGIGYRELVGMILDSAERRSFPPVSTTAGHSTGDNA